MSARLAARRQTAAIRARRTQRPFGFVVLAAAAACCAMVAVGSLAEPSYPPGWHASPWERGVLGAVAALSLVAVEAFWFLRPWATRACVALSLALAAWMLLPDPWSFESYEPSAALFRVGVVALFVFAPVLLYVRRRAAGFAARGAAPPASGTRQSTGP